MTLFSLISMSRSFRRFDQQHTVSQKTLRDLVNLARLSPSGMNIQALKYALSSDPAINSRIFPLLGWAGYLKDWSGPVEGERPAAYITILGDTTIMPSFGIDQGIAAQSIMLGATELGLGGCIIATINKKVMHHVHKIPEHYEILLVLALGKPVEKVGIVPVSDDGSIQYWRDDQGTHYVPKRALEDLIID
jgi:nitroreductase